MTKRKSYRVRDKEAIHDDLSDLKKEAEERFARGGAIHGQPITVTPSASSWTVASTTTTPSPHSHVTVGSVNLVPAKPFSAVTTYFCTACSWKYYYSGNGMAPDQIRMIINNHYIDHATGRVKNHDPRVPVTIQNMVVIS